METDRKSPRTRAAAGLAAALAAVVCAAGLAGSAAPAATAGLTSAASLTTMRDATSPTADPAAIAGADVAQFAVGSPAMDAAEQIAVAFWNTAPCAGVITISWGSLDPSINATSSWWNPVAAYGNAAANSQCSIVFNTAQQYDWPMFCTVLVHEFGHLAGNQHVTDPTNVMYPVYVAPIAQCTGPAPAGVNASGSSATPAPAPVVQAHAAVHKHHKARKHHKAKAKH